MDPYLEHPDVFPGFHGSLIANLKAALQAILPEAYFADSDERIWLEVSDRLVRPDVGVIRRGQREDDVTAAGSGAVSTIPRTQVVLVAGAIEERKEYFLEIYSRIGDEDRLVTAIEVLSPTNKTPGLDRRSEYLKKQREMVLGQVNLVEIDLLRGGQHTTAVPRERALQVAGTFDYQVCVHRFDRRGDFFVYPIQLAQRLPVIDVPLLPEDGAVQVDLQAVFARTYDEGPYRKRIRYGVDGIVPSLLPGQAEWAKTVLAGHSDGGR
jgi:hypothetical protein